MLTPDRQEGWAKVFLANRPKLIHGLIAMTGNVHLAEDVADEALLIIRDYFDRYENPLAALFKIAKQELHRRSVSIPVQMVSLDGQMEEEDRQKNRTTGLNPTTDVDENVDVMKMLKELPARQREVIALVVMCDLKASEVAEILGIAESSVNTHKQRGLDKLQELINERTPPPSQNDVKESAVRGGIV